MSLFVFGLVRTGIALFVVDSQGDVLAQSLFGGDLTLVNTSLRLPFAVMTNQGLMALLAGENSPSYVIDVFDPFHR
jgi:hypothetical protein